MRSMIDMAREAGCATFQHGWIASDSDLKAFEDLVRADEREACAKVCDTTPPYPFRPSIEAAHAIRARGNT